MNYYATFKKPYFKPILSRFNTASDNIKKYFTGVRFPSSPPTF